MEGYVTPPAQSRPTKPAQPAAPARCNIGGKAGLELNCRPLPGPSGGGGSLSILGLLKSAANFLYHVSGAADVVGCIRHPTLGGCALAAADIVSYAVGGFGGKVLVGVTDRVAENLTKDLLVHDVPQYTLGILRRIATGQATKADVQRLALLEAANKGVRTAIQPYTGSIANAFQSGAGYLSQLQGSGGQGTPTPQVGYTCARFGLDCARPSN